MIKIDCIYILNLESEKWKYYLLLKKINKIPMLNNLKIERIEAINGKERKNIIIYQKYKKLYIDRKKKILSNIKFKYFLKNNKNIGLFRSYGSFGCLLSNIKIIENAIDNNYENILILQDDIYFHKNFNNLFSEYLRKIEHFTGIYLGFSQHKSTSKKHINEKTAGLFSILLNKKCFQEILNEYRKYQDPDDVCVAKILGNKYIDTSYKINPPLIIPDTTKSNNIIDRPLKEHSKKMGWNLELYDLSEPYY